MELHLPALFSSSFDPLPRRTFLSQCHRSSSLSNTLNTSFTPDIGTEHRRGLYVRFKRPTNFYIAPTPSAWYADTGLRWLAPPLYAMSTHSVVYLLPCWYPPDTRIMTHVIWTQTWPRHPFRARLLTAIALLAVLIPICYHSTRLY